METISLHDGLVAWQGGDVAKARAAFEAAHAERPDDIKAWFLDAALAIEAQRNADAKAALARVAAIAPDFHLARYWLGQLERHDGDLAAARDHFAAAAPGFADVLPFHMQAGRLALEAGDGAAAVAAFRQAVALDGADPDALGALGLALAETGAHKDALAALGQAVEAAPASALPWLQIGFVLGTAGQNADAAQAYGYALKREPDNVGAWLNLGVLKARMEDTAGAQEAFAAAVQADPMNDDAQFLLAFSQAGTDQHQEARRRFEALAARRPRHALFAAIKDAFARPEGA